jgi:hypothetical protein
LCILNEEERNKNCSNKGKERKENELRSSEINGKNYRRGEEMRNEDKFFSLGFGGWSLLCNVCFRL